MLSQIACHLSSVDLITFAFIEGDSDGGEGFLIWRHTDLRGLDSKARIAAFEIKTAKQRFQIGFQLLLLVFFYRLPRSTTAHYHVAEAGPGAALPETPDYR
ncbi:hypothetical protein MJ588_02330 [Klebsiella pneumoniae]|nr:hypothetical protein MJ588_02330 [Klebsiella pneumoniae]